MPKYDYELTLCMTIEADDFDEAEEEAEYHKSRLVDNGLAGDLGYTEVVWKVKKHKANKE
jgi:hypothetical protein